MTRTELHEAIDLIDLICARLAVLPSVATTSAAADLRRLTGAAAVDAEAMLRSGSLSSRMLACFQAALTAGATFAGFYALRMQVAVASAAGRPAQIVRQDATRRCLVQMARASAATDFKTFDAVAAAQTQINSVFGAAEVEMLDAQDTDTYRAIVALHAAVTRDLTSRARPLPRVVTVTSGSSVPALVLAQRLYGDAGRANDLIAANGVIAPLFMPQAIQALSA